MIVILHYNSLVSNHLIGPNGFGPEVKTRGSNPQLPDKKRQYKKLVVIVWGINLDLLKLGAQGGIGIAYRANIEYSLPLNFYDYEN